jgi:hypothetical protein
MVSKQKYGKQYSHKYVNDYDDDEQDFDVMTAFSYIGSKDSLLPKHMKYSIKSKSQGWNRPNMVSML